VGSDPLCERAESGHEHVLTYSLELAPEGCPQSSGRNAGTRQ
jgi:hypothetical protein